MGGRGSSSGISDKGKPYGTEYETLLTSGNIKFVRRNEGNATAPLETMTKGRVYVTVDNSGEELKAITFYSRAHGRFRQIDLDHYHKINGKSEKPHVQLGYYHDGEASVPTEKDNRLLYELVFHCGSVSVCKSPKVYISALEYD